MIVHLKNKKIMKEVQMRVKSQRSDKENIINSIIEGTFLTVCFMEVV